MIGAIIGDIVGSRFEWKNHRNKKFELFTDKCFFTDDSVMTVAIAKAVLTAKKDRSNLGEKAVFWMRDIGRNYQNCGYGGNFMRWMFSDVPKPYNSYGNGAAMRVSPCAFAAETIEDAIDMSKKVTEVTHGHAEGIKGAEATTAAIFLARNGASIEEIGQYIKSHYYDIDFTLEKIRDEYKFNETCQMTVPQAIEAFLESDSFEDSIRNAVSIGGDSDTLAAITGSIAEGFYGVPERIRLNAESYLDERLFGILKEFESIYGR